MTKRSEAAKAVQHLMTSPEFVTFLRYLNEHFGFVDTSLFHENHAMMACREGGRVLLQEIGRLQVMSVEALEEMERE